jgi:hypothetical protein
MHENLITIERGLQVECKQAHSTRIVKLMRIQTNSNKRYSILCSNEHHWNSIIVSQAFCRHSTIKWGVF